MEDDGFILVSRDGKCSGNVPQDDFHGYMSEIDNFIEGIRAFLWPLNKFIHENPELAFQEYQAHEVLTNFMRSREGWQVTKSAYGIETAWVAAYDSGKPGPVVSFNVEMGKPTLHIVQRGNVADISRRAPRSRPRVWSQPYRHSLARRWSYNSGDHQTTWTPWQGPSLWYARRGRGRRRQNPSPRGGRL